MGIPGRSPLGLALSCALVTAVGCGKSDEKKSTEPAGTAKVSTEAPPATPKLIPAKPLTIAYSDWPGWVAWDVAIQKGWFEEAGVNVEFKWFEYVPSMDAFAAGKVDAVTITNGDALVTGAGGAPGVAIVINDYSNGNDMVVAAPGIESMADLKGKKIGVEVGFVSHLLLMNALEKAGMTEKDVTLVNVPTDQTPQLLKSGGASAIVAWQPNSGQALESVPGSKAIFTSADVPGIIYDVLSVSPKSLAENREAWKKVVGVWFRVADYIEDPANRDEVLKIMSARVGLTPDKYAGLMKGTHFLGLDGNVKHFAPGPDLTSIVHSSKVVNGFNVANDVYKEEVAITPYIDPSLVQEIAADAKPAAKTETAQAKAAAPE